MNGWSCPHQVDGQCEKVPGFACVPGMRGCVLVSKYRFFTDDGERRPPRPTRVGADVEPTKE